MLSTDQRARAHFPAIAASTTDQASVAPAVSSAPTVEDTPPVVALQTAAEKSRAAALEVLQGHGKAAIELAQARSADEASGLRRAADNDMAGIRAWSTTEIARIQAETDERVGARTAALERELGDHAERVERELERISTAVATFAAQMEQFFGAVDQQPRAVDLASAFAAAESEAALDAAALEREERAGQSG